MSRRDFFQIFVCFIFNVSLGSAPKRKNFDIQRNTRVASGGQFTLNYHTPSRMWWFIHVFQGKELTKWFKLRESGSSVRCVALCCKSTLLVQHPAYRWTQLSGLVIDNEVGALQTLTLSLVRQNGLGTQGFLAIIALQTLMLSHVLQNVLGSSCHYLHLRPSFCPLFIKMVLAGKGSLQ